MRAKFVNESLNGPIVTTVDKLFSWYSGNNWVDDWETTNTMTVNNKHAQDDGINGKSHLKTLSRHKDEVIEVYYEEEFGSYDIWFSLVGNKYMIQSVSVPFENDNDDFDEEKMREDLYDPQDDSERFRSRQPGDNFDLDQDIYDRNPDWDVDESAKSSSVLDYSEAAYKMDKFMPDVPDLQDEYYEILGSGDVDALEEFLELNADEEILYRYMPRGGTIRGLANYMIENE